MPTIGSQIRTARRARGLTQLALCHTAGLTIAALSKIEHDVSQATVPTLCRIADALGLSLVIDGKRATLVEPASIRVPPAAD